MKNIKQITPLPTEQIFTVFLVQFCEANNMNVLFPFLAFMVEYFGYTGQELGYHAGALAGTFCAAQLFSSIPWGTFSDKYGRKPGIFFGILGSSIGMLVLGFAKNYYQAILGRAISGILSGNGGVIKSFLKEITDDSNRGKGFSYMQLGWSIGAICGPLAGGLLCYPANKFPTYFSQDGIFGQHPFLLPCLFCASINLFTAIYSFFFMKESRKWQNDNNISNNNYNNNTSSQGYYQLSAIESNKNEINQSKDLDIDAYVDVETDTMLNDDFTPDKPNVENPDDKVLNNQSILAVTCYGLCCMAFIVMDESVPLFLKLDTTFGGFSFTSTQIGSLLSVGGIAMLLWSMLFLPYVSNGSKLQLFKICSLIGIPIALSYPVLGSLRLEIISLFGEDIGQKIIFGWLAISVTARNVLSTTIFMSVVILLNHSAYDYQLGTLNGIGQTVAAAARSIGPALGGILWSLSTRLHFLYINFLLSTSIFLLINYVAQKLPATIDFEKVKNNQNHQNDNKK